MLCKCKRVLLPSCIRNTSNAGRKLHGRTGQLISKFKRIVLIVGFIESDLGTFGTHCICYIELLVRLEDFPEGVVILARQNASE